MSEIKCPKCGETFQIDEANYAAIVKQVRDKEFKAEISNREKSFNKEKELAVQKAEADIEKNFTEQLQLKDTAIAELQSQIKQKDLEIENKLLTATQNTAKEITVKNNQIEQLNAKLEQQKLIKELEAKETEEKYHDLLKEKDEQIAYLKDFKAKLSTKMVGETLEKHCQSEFERIRPLFPNAYFDKDNDIRNGSKGDFIFRDFDDDVEYVSIMFEMKNQNDETATKHKNEDFLKELDKDRKEKKCEYAVLVSLLEIDNEIYSGITDVSHKYEKMYVIRPQFFIPLITLLTNTSKKAIGYKRQLAIAQDQSLDFTKFEQELNSTKEKIQRNHDLALSKFGKAIEEIDKSISSLTKMKEDLLSSEKNFRLANEKAKDLDIKRLTKNSPSLREKFEKIKQN